MSMSQARFERIISGMNAAARKVFDATPIAESWDYKQIAAELRRSGLNSDSHVVLGCLDTLVRSGLVNEVGRGKFRREEVKPTVLKQSNQKDEPMTTAAKAKPTLTVKVAPAKQASSPMDMLGDLAARAANIANLVKELSSDISDAAVEIQTGLESSEEDMQKFKQLQSLLKGII